MEPPQNELGVARSASVAGRPPGTRSNSASSTSKIQHSAAGLKGGGFGGAIWHPQRDGSEAPLRTRRCARPRGRAGRRPGAAREQPGPLGDPAGAAADARADAGAPGGLARAAGGAARAGRRAAGRRRRSAAGATGGAAGIARGGRQVGFVVRAVQGRVRLSSSAPPPTSDARSRSSGSTPATPPAPSRSRSSRSSR